MDLSAYISFDVHFDLAGYPTLKLTDKTNYAGAGVAMVDVTIWYEVRQPDGIMVAYGSSTSSLPNPSIPMRLDSVQKHQRGQYTVKMYAKHSTDVANFSRVWEFGYTEPAISLVEDFDTFTPKLMYRDLSSYSVIHYDLTASTVSWSVTIQGVGTLAAATSTIDLSFGGKYYSAVYDIDFLRSVTWRHQSNSWLTVSDSFEVSLEKSVFPPPTHEQMVAALDAMHEEAVADSVAAGAINEKTEEYVYAQGLFSQIMFSLAIGTTKGLMLALKQFVRTTKGITQAVTNAPLSPYTFDSVSTGTLWRTAEVDIAAAETSSVELTDLIGRKIETLMLDGISRKVFEGAAPVGTVGAYFLFDPATGILTYSDILYQGQWIKVIYSAS